MRTWNIQKTQFKVSDFINWARNGELNLSPSFQRRSVWSLGAKSYLLDSILRGLPIPPLILRELPPDIKTFKSIREVVDGQQRIRTVLSFIAPQVLNDFSVARDQFLIKKAHNKELGGCGFKDLDSSTQQQVLNYQFMVHIFPSETDDRDILEIFARMNATGTKLNHQELRNAEYFGEFKTAAFSLAAEHLSLWREWKIFSESDIARMAEVEFTSELMIFALQGVSDNSTTVIDKAYHSFDEVFSQRDEITRRVRYILELIGDKLKGKYDPVLKSKAMMYPLFAAAYQLSFVDSSDLAPQTAIPIARTKLDKMAERAARILSHKEDVPQDVLLAAEARASQAKNRKIIIKHLLS